MTYLGLPRKYSHVSETNSILVTHADHLLSFAHLSNISNPILGNVCNVWCHVVLHVFYQVVLESNMLFSGECPKGAHIVPLLQFCFSFSTVTLVTTNLKTLWAHIHTHVFMCAPNLFWWLWWKNSNSSKTKTTKSGTMWAP